MKKSYIIIGLGRFGRAVATSLFESGCEVLAVDKNRDTINEIQNHVTYAVVGDCTDEEVLAQLGVENFDMALVTMGDDSSIEASIMVTASLKELGAPYVVARSNNEFHSRILKKIGADMVIMPEHDMGIKFAQSVSSSNILNLINLSDRYSIVEIPLPSKWAEKTLRDIDIRRIYGVTVIAVCRGEELMVSPTAETELKGGDTLVIAGHNEDIEKIRK